MTTSRSNVGHVDALSRRIIGTFAALAGIVSLNSFFWSMPFLSWLVLVFMFCTGLFFLIGGVRGGTGVFGFLVMLLAVFDGWMAVLRMGHWALLVSWIVAADAFITASLGWSPVNALLHRDTHDADSWWALPPAGVH
jgi:hypothetical protein